MYYELFLQMKKQLGQLDKWLDTAAAFANTNSIDSKDLLETRLIADQFPLVRQVQIACDTAKLAASRLTGKEAPVQADTETTIDELHARIQSVIDYLNQFKASDFENAAARVITQPRWEGRTMTGADYFIEHAVPNFFFHLNHAYAILRHKGVGLGKKDYLGTLTQKHPS